MPQRGSIFLESYANNKESFAEAWNQRCPTCYVLDLIIKTTCKCIVLILHDDDDDDVCLVQVILTLGNENQILYTSLLYVQVCS